MEIRRFLTAGEVDDGKSTLIGRLFHDAGLIREDQLAQIKDNLAHFTDGLKEERARGITMDVAYRFFETEDRKFIVADGPGHLPYIRHMVTAASLADAAIILVDATRGVSLQTKRHAWVATWLGVPSIVFVINKMDARHYDEKVFAAIKAQLPNIPSLVLPASALVGDNIVHRSTRMPWYQGPTLMEWLEKLPAKLELSKDRVRFPVQLSEGHVVSGTLAAGHLRNGQTLFVGEEKITLEEIYAHPEKLAQAEAGQALRLKLSRECKRGDLVTSEPFRPSQHWKAQWLLFSQPKGQLIAQAHHWSGKLLSTSVEQNWDWSSLNWEKTPHSEFPLLQEGTLELEKPLLDEHFTANSPLGQMIWIDEQTGETVAAVLLKKAL